MVDAECGVVECTTTKKGSGIFDPCRFESCLPHE